MTAPFPCQPGDKLRVIATRPYGTTLVPGDLVTVESVRVRAEAVGRPAMPVVIVSTAHGRQILGFDAVEPFAPPTYTPAEPDDVVDAFFFGILGADDELRDWAVTAREELAANDPAASAEYDGGGVAIAEEAAEPRHATQVGPAFQHTDGDGDQLRVTYREKECANHGREGGFIIRVNGDAVLIPATEIDGLIRYLFQMKKHSERPE